MFMTREREAQLAEIQQIQYFYYVQAKIIKRRLYQRHLNTFEHTYTRALIMLLLDLE